MLNFVLRKWQEMYSDLTKKDMVESIPRKLLSHTVRTDNHFYCQLWLNKATFSFKNTRIK